MRTSWRVLFAVLLAAGCTKGVGDRQGEEAVGHRDVGGRERAGELGA